MSPLTHKCCEYGLGVRWLTSSPRQHCSFFSSTDASLPAAATSQSSLRRMTFRAAWRPSNAFLTLHSDGGSCCWMRARVIGWTGDWAVSLARSDSIRITLHVLNMLHVRISMHHPQWFSAEVCIRQAYDRHPSTIARASNAVGEAVPEPQESQAHL